ncbi:LysR family transcriptional regulator [Pelagibacterium lacus]|uniref:LysR family transcriptional regulator n=1 Tax=Pelagibacterium lacus TaxID=2282655 RepID=A0A369W574_9HYPH|nr:LysR family transcriptional regulator [Pelagibacterium lacus]RDE08402.1 LysR family transcriptional regulator [Pelagibacterium lacus]
MTQDLARIRAFVQVFDAGGFSAAARIHGRSKALLSKYVTDLEDYLGVRLMNRTTRKLSLTEAGEAYYREVREILSQLDDLDATITDQSAAPRGILRVSAPRNFGERTLLDPLFEFTRQHPDVTLDLRLEDRMVDLVEEGIDVALRISRMPDTSLIARKIAETSVAVCATPGVIRAYGAPKTPEALKGVPCIVDTNMTGQANWQFVEDGRTVTVHVDGPVKVNSPVGSLVAAQKGLGFALLPSFLSDSAISKGELVPVLTDFLPQRPFLQAVYPHRRHLSGKVRALIDFLVEWFETNSVNT